MEDKHAHCLQSDFLPKQVEDYYKGIEVQDLAQLNESFTCAKLEVPDVPNMCETPDKSVASTSKCAKM